MIEHIEYLISRHDCVVVPGWGAFIANYESASYDEAKAAMRHPERTIGFNASVSHNDGLLAQSIVRREGLTFDAAMRFIADSVVSYRQQLAKDCEVSFGHLGCFRRNEGQYIEFVPMAQDNACDQFYGLTDFDVKTVAALEQEQALNDSPAAIVPRQRNLFSRKAAQVAASVAALLALGVLFSTPIIVDRNHQDMASMTPAVTAPQSQQLGVTVQQGVVAQPVEMVQSGSAIASVGNTTGKYYMVIATLRNQQELDAFKNKYADLVPYMKLLDYKGMMCVYVARSDDYGQLMSLRDELPERLRDVWIYN